MRACMYTCMRVCDDYGIYRMTLQRKLEMKCVLTVNVAVDFVIFVLGVSITVNVAVQITVIW